MDKRRRCANTGGRNPSGAGYEQPDAFFFGCLPGPLGNIRLLSYFTRDNQDDGLLEGVQRPVTFGPVKNITPVSQNEQPSEARWTWFFRCFLPEPPSVSRLQVYDPANPSYRRCIQYGHNRTRKWLLTYLLYSNRANRRGCLQ